VSRTKKAKEKQIHEVIRSRPNHVFVSYLRENKAIVDRICDELRARGVKVWLDRYEIAPGAYSTRT
jgi:2-phosphoglycerate kinase